MIEQQLSRRLRKRNAALAALIALTLWTSSAVLAWITLLILWTIGKYVIYSVSALGQLSVSVLTVTGVVAAILFAVFTAINGQSRENRYSGFQTLRRAMEDLENLNTRLKRQALELEHGIAAVNLPPYSIAGQRLDAVRYWVADLGRLLHRLDSITMNWRGWETDLTLENELLSYISFAKSISKSLRDDTNVTLTVFEQSMRSILIGLRRLDEAAISDLLLMRLSAILGSLITLTGFGLGFCLAANLDIGFTSNSNVILFDAVFISVNALLHLFALVIFVSRWWDQVRKRDDSWAS
jgi:hypothetical protein